MTIDVQPSALKLSARVAAEIRAEMARQRMSGRQLAQKVGRSPNWVSLKLGGTARLDFEDAEVFASTLGVSVMELLRRAQEGPSTSTYAYDEAVSALLTEPELVGVAASTETTRRVGSPLSRTYPAGRRPPGRPSGLTRPSSPRHAARTGR